MVHAWQVARARNLDLIRPGRMMRFGAYWPTYGIDAYAYARLLTGIETVSFGKEKEEAVRCYFFVRNAVLWVALRNFELGVAKCLDFHDLRQPRPSVVPFQEKFGPLDWDYTSQIVNTDVPGFVQKFI